MSNPTLQRAASPPPSARASNAAISNLLANYGLLFVFLLIMLVFGLLRPSSFFSATNLNAILVSQSVTAILALAVMVPLATKQFDLSVGYHLGMAQVLIVGLQVTTGLPWPVAAVLILLASLLVGFINGLLVTYFRIDSFIATMGTGTLLYGVTNWYTNGEQIVGMGLPDSFTGLTQIVYGIPLASRLCRDYCGGAVGRHGALAGWPKPLCHRRQCSRRGTHGHQRSAPCDGRVHRGGAA